MVAMLITFTAMGIAATAFGRRFRFYTIATIVLALGFGLWSALEAPRIEQGLATPWVGLKERIFWYGYQSWFIVLALTLLRRPVEVSTETSGGRGEQTLDSGDAPYRAFRSPEAEAAFFAAYDAVMKRWPVPYEELDIPTRFGTTHVIAAGPENAPALVLLHGYIATSVMWAPNITDFSRDYRVYAIDVMGQPSKSVPGEPVRDTADYVAWLTDTLDGLHLGRVSLLGMSFGGWVALKYAMASPDRIQHLVLLSPGGFLPMVRQFALRGMLMTFFPARFTVNSFMRWAGLSNTPGEKDAGPVLRLMYLGAKHFQIPKATLRANAAAASAASDDEIRSLHMPVLLLFGDGEVIYDSAKALDRARRLIPDFEGELIPRCRHDMCFSQSRIVDARVLDFLRRNGQQDAPRKQRSIA
jgi:pimeloyl-ACP methyl ester carboxylesterase